MYIKKSNYKFHPKYTTKEKEEIALLYINNEMRATQIVKEFNLANNNVLYRWVKQYKEFGKIFETRGKTTKFNNPNKGRPKKYPEKPLEELSKKEPKSNIDKVAIETITSQFKFNKLRYEHMKAYKEKIINGLKNIQSNFEKCYVENNGKISGYGINERVANTK